jgi:hypothetical protein
MLSGPCHVSPLIIKKKKKKKAKWPFRSLLLFSSITATTPSRSFPPYLEAHFAFVASISLTPEKDLQRLKKKIVGWALAKDFKNPNTQSSFPLITRRLVLSHRNGNVCFLV